MTLGVLFFLSSPKSLDIHTYMLIDVSIIVLLEGSSLGSSLEDILAIEETEKQVNSILTELGSMEKEEEKEEEKDCKFGALAYLKATKEGSYVDLFIVIYCLFMWKWFGFNVRTIQNTHLFNL